MKKILLILPLFFVTPAMAKSHKVAHAVAKIAEISLPVAVGTVVGDWVYHSYVEAPKQESTSERDNDYSRDERVNKESTTNENNTVNDSPSYNIKTSSGFTGP